MRHVPINVELICKSLRIAVEAGEEQGKGDTVGDYRSMGGERAARGVISRVSRVNATSIQLDSSWRALQGTHPRAAYAAISPV